jgi:hypothetical protein
MCLSVAVAQHILTSKIVVICEDTRWITRKLQLSLPGLNQHLGGDCMEEEWSVYPSNTDRAWREDCEGCSYYSSYRSRMTPSPFSTLAPSIRIGLAGAGAEP